jgi:adenylosuccinate lyase
MDLSALNALSPVDGRYAAAAQPLRAYLTEGALIRERIRVEALWFKHLSQTGVALLRAPLPPSVMERVMQLAQEPGDAAAEAVKAIEQRINHDVKSVEYFVRDALAAAGADSAALELVHFGCTSEDVNNLSYARLLSSARAQVLLPELQSLIAILQSLAQQYADTPMLARTHGQAASPDNVRQGSGQCRRSPAACQAPSGECGSARKVERCSRKLQCSSRREARSGLAGSHTDIHRQSAIELEPLHDPDRTT